MCATRLDTHCHICCWASCRAHPPVSCSALLNKLENEMTVHIMAFLTISFNTSCTSPSGMVQCRHNPVGPLQGSRSSRVILSWFFHLFCFHHTWYYLFLITQLLLLIGTTHSFKFLISSVETKNVGEKWFLLWCIYITNRWSIQKVKESEISILLRSKAGSDVQGNEKTCVES